MKKLLYFFALLVCVVSHSQNGEFQVYDNGLIYSDVTVGKLKHIVDSLNLKFKTCEPKSYYSVKQSKAIYVRVSTKNVKEAKKDIEANISLEAFVAKYPKALVVRDNLVITHEYFDEDEDGEMISFSSVELGDNPSFGFTISETDYARKYAKAKGKWISEYSEQSDYSEEDLTALYFQEDFSIRKISSKYQQMIQYSECLIDTTSQIFSEKAQYSGRRFYDTLPNKISALNDFIEKTLKQPDFDSEKFNLVMDFEDYSDDKPKKKLSKKEKAEKEKLKKQAEEDFDTFQKKMAIWESLRLTRLDSLKNTNPAFIRMLNEALTDAKGSAHSDDQLEELVARYISKEEALQLKRDRRVVGGCSMDSSPRYHAVNIAILSAETTKWDVFLKSHLNVMNDRFDRVSDGSWAQAARQTYIRELEVLDINVPDLLLGTSFRINNPVKNHYYADIGRLGRALTESKDKVVFEKQILDAIEDPNLDDYNRIVMYYLFLNYNHYIKDEPVKNENLSRLKQSVKKLPVYLFEKIKFES
ncbi:hypothetical protein ABGT15_06730 [Flavobacterium enshiense]|uniref:hypothetical protein n=1 Tax=Flavobacterium enshiense TaxID=1341165 RepID=UPI00345CEDC2